MGHCISVFLIKKSELRDDKILSLVDERKYTVNIKWVELDENILVTTEIQNIKKFSKDKLVAKISTDYFGGIGGQSAKLFDNNKMIFNGQDEYNDGKTYYTQPINEVLKLMGISRKFGMDEFDTIGIGRYRSNNDFKNVLI